MPAKRSNPTPTERGQATMHRGIEMGNKIAVLLIFVLVLSACTSEPTLVPTNTNATSAISGPFPTSLAGTPRWVLYERALSYIFLGLFGNTQPHMGWDHGLCEWEIWGQKGKEVYVWAICQANNALEQLLWKIS